jgi:hypothetical protein
MWKNQEQYLLFILSYKEKVMFKEKWFFVLHAIALLLFPLYAKAQFWDQGLVTGTVNTSYKERYIGTQSKPITYLGCLFQVTDIGAGCSPTRPTV